MRILISTVAYPPYVSGVSVFTRHLAEYLARAGHTVQVVAPAVQRGDQAPNQTTLPVVAGLTIRRVRTLPNPFRRGFGVPHLSRSSLEQLVRELQPDIIHAQDPLPVSRTLQAIARRHQIPFVATNHVSIELITAYLPRWLRPLASGLIARWLAAFFNRCSAVTAPTDTVVAMLKQRGVRVPLHTISNGIDAARFTSVSVPKDLRDRFGIPAGPVVINVGRLDQDKSVDVLLDALAIVCQERPVHAVVVGGGNLLDWAKHRATALGLAERITFTGQILHDDSALPQLLTLATCFVTASTIETQGLAVLEAMAAGKPIVAVQAGALPEIVGDGTNGFLVEPGDAAALARQTIKLLDDSALVASMGTASQRIAHVHALPEPLKRFEALYTSLKR